MIKWRNIRNIGAKSGRWLRTAPAKRITPITPRACLHGRDDSAPKSGISYLGNQNPNRSYKFPRKLRRVARVLRKQIHYDKGCPGSGLSDPGTTIAECNLRRLANSMTGGFAVIQPATQAADRSPMAQAWGDKPKKQNASPFRGVRNRWVPPAPRLLFCAFAGAIPNRFKPIPGPTTKNLRFPQSLPGAPRRDFETWDTPFFTSPNCRVILSESRTAR